MNLGFWRLFWIPAALGTCLVLLNLCLLFRDQWYPRLHGHPPEHNVSGVPIVGSGLLWLSALGFWWQGHSPAALIAFLVSLCDVGGLHLVLIAILLQGHKRT